MKRRLCLILTTILVIVTSTISFVGADSLPTIQSENTGIEGLDEVLQQADNITQIKDTFQYTYSGDLNATITKSIQDDGSIKLIFEEQGKEDTIVIKQNTNEVFLNGKIVEYYYDDEEKSIQMADMSSGAAKVRYHNSTSPAYGKSGNYTKYLKSKSVKDIQLNQAISGIGVAALLAIISIPCPSVGGLLSVAVAIKGAFDATHTKHLSFKSKIYLHKSHPSGWYQGTYCEKHATTWYAAKNYGGDTKKKNTFRIGVVI